MEFKEILFYSSVLVFTVGYISFKYYEKKYESFTKDQSDEKNIVEQAMPIYESLYKFVI